MQSSVVSRSPALSCIRLQHRQLFPLDRRSPLAMLAPPRFTSLDGRQPAPGVARGAAGRYRGSWECCGSAFQRAVLPGAVLGSLRQGSCPLNRPLQFEASPQSTTGDPQSPFPFPQSPLSSHRTINHTHKRTLTQPPPQPSDPDSPMATEGGTESFGETMALTRGTLSNLTPRRTCQSSALHRCGERVGRPRAPIRCVSAGLPLRRCCRGAR